MVFNEEDSMSKVINTRFLCISHRFLAMGEVFCRRGDKKPEGLA